MPTPRCGHCQYNLTGIEENRCPECGLLFIEAGVNLKDERRWSTRKVVPFAAFVFVIIFIGFSISYFFMSRARLQAAVARQQAVATQQQAAAAARRQALEFYKLDPSGDVLDTSEFVHRLLNSNVNTATRERRQRRLKAFRQD